MPTSYVHLSNALLRYWEDPMTYLEVKVAALSEIPQSNATVHANASGTRSAGSREAPQSQGPSYQVLSAQGAGGQPQLLAGGALARRDWAEPAPAAALYACKGLHGGQTRYVEGDEPVQIQSDPAQASADGPEASQRRGEPSGRALEWYLLDGGAPQIDLAVPFFLFQVARVSDATRLDRIGRCACERAARVRACSARSGKSGPRKSDRPCCAG